MNAVVALAVAFVVAAWLILMRNSVEPFNQLDSLDRPIVIESMVCKPWPCKPVKTATVQRAVAMSLPFANPNNLIARVYLAANSPAVLGSKNIKGMLIRLAQSLSEQSRSEPDPRKRSALVRYSDFASSVQQSIVKNDVRLRVYRQPSNRPIYM